LFDEETVVQLQSVAACELADSSEVGKVGREFWVKMVEAEPTNATRGAEYEPGYDGLFSGEAW
jgi:hypothetical protein